MTDNEFTYEDEARRNGCRVAPAPTGGLMVEVAHGPSERRTTSTVVIPAEMVEMLVPVVMLAAGWTPQKIGAAMNPRRAMGQLKP